MVVKIPVAQLADYVHTSGTMLSYSAAPRSLQKFAARFAILILLLTGAAAGQVSAPLPVPADCVNEGLETALHVYQAPENVQVIALNYRNKTERVCTLRPDGGPAQGPLLTLEPGAVAHSSFRWRTQASSVDAPCHELNDRRMSVNRSSYGLLLVSRTLLPQICSEVQYGAYFPGPFTPDWKIPVFESSTVATAPILTASKQMYYQNEHVDLRLKLTIEMPSAISCPVLFETMRDEHGSTRIDEIVNPKTGCHNSWGGMWKGPPDEFDIDAGENSRWGGLGPRTITVLELSGAAPDGELRLVPSNSVTFQIADASSIQRVWGKTEEGVRADLTLDTTEYSLGKDVPLHIAIENVSAAVRVYGEPFRPRPAFGNYLGNSLEVTVQDEDGPLVPQFNGLFPSTTGGPSLCPGSVGQGKPVSLEMSLGRLGLLPRKPGTYKIVVRWSPYTTQYSSCEEVPRWRPDAPQEKPFVTVTSTPVTIHIAGEARAKDVPEFPDYTAWKRRFELADTSFGEKTALLDKATRLEWLRVNLTTHLSEEATRKAMEAGGRFEGWRFATSAEVLVFFAHFTGTPDGKTTDPAIERKLQRLLGGPLSTAENSQTGWGRASTSVRIAGLTPAPYDRTPQNPAIAPGSPTRCPTCGAGFLYSGASIYEDIQNGRVDAHVIPVEGGGWTSMDGSGTGEEGLFLVRKQ
jgi:hypothetical protein